MAANVAITNKGIWNQDGASMKKGLFMIASPSRSARAPCPI